MSQDCNDIIIVENQNQVIWSERVSETIIGNSREKNEIIVVDLSVNLIEESAPASVPVVTAINPVTQIDPIPAINFNVIGTGFENQTVTLVFLPEETWTDFPPTQLAEVVDFKVYNSDGEEITEAFEYRRSPEGQLQIYSLNSYSNLKIELEG